MDGLRKTKVNQVHYALSTYSVLALQYEGTEGQRTVELKPQIQFS